jgi:uncharacterized protein
MGWSTTTIDLTFNVLNHLPNPLLGPRLLSLHASSRAALKPPFPDVVVAMGRRSLPVARWIKKQSGNRSKIIMLGRKAVAGPEAIDLLIGCVHFQQLPRRGLFALTVPPTKVDADTLALLRQNTKSPYRSGKAKRILVLLGGPTAQHSFDAEDANTMTSTLLNAATAAGGELTFLTSRRTPPAAIAAITAAAPQAHMEVWQKHKVDNPYLTYLAHADVIVVTGESESMIAEAAASKKPLTIFPLREKPLQLKHRVALRVFKAAAAPGRAGEFARRLLHNGWMIPARDLKLMHQVLVERGQANVFAGTINMSPPRMSAEVDQLKIEINRLFENAKARDDCS